MHGCSSTCAVGTTSINRSIFILGGLDALKLPVPAAARCAFTFIAYVAE